MNRFGAFAVHLGISLIIFLILGYVILFHWYPDFFFTSDGGWQGIRLIAFVDLVLGPVLTLVVFNRAKPTRELRRDLSIIAIVQISCLAAGIYIVYTERPIAMVFADGIFTSMTAEDYLSASQPVPDLRSFPGNSPKWVSVRLPEDPGAQSTIRREALANRTPIRTLARFYQPFSKDHVDADRDGIPHADLVARDAMTPFIGDFLAEHGGKLTDYAFLVFGTRYSRSLIAMSTVTGTVAFVSVPALPDTEAATAN